jgi:hypothetical protein
LPLVQVPTLLLTASHDRLLSRSTSAVLSHGLRDCRSVRVPGPHLLLQAAVDAGAREVAEFVLSELRGSEAGVAPTED